MIDAWTQSGALFSGKVMHLRQPEEDGPRKPHQFRYSVFRLLLDLDAMTHHKPRLLSFDRWNLLSVYKRDHGPCDGSDLRDWADQQLAQHSLPRPKRVLLYAFPRVLGYVFNPLSVYFCLGTDGRLDAVIYEVRNTLGDLHPYVFALNGRDEALRKHGTDKEFYVSPFIRPEQRYGFTLCKDQESLALRIRVDGPQGLTLIATENTNAQPLSDWNILATCLQMPLMTAKVMLGIYFEAIRLRLKGAKMFRHPGANGVFAQIPAASKKVDAA